MDSDQVIIAIDGLIGAGKTSFIEILKKKFSKEEIFFSFEPVTEFEKFENFNPLALQSINPFFLQLHIIRCLKTHFKNLLKKAKCAKIIVTERSFDSPLIFIDTSYCNGSISLMEKMMLEKILQETKEEIGLGEPSGIFFLSCSPEKCYQRVLLRNRISELKIVNLEYLTVLKKSYERYFSQKYKNMLRYASYDINQPEKLVSDFIEFVNDIKKHNNNGEK